MLAVGCDDTSAATGGKVFIYEFSENSRRWTKIETISSITEPVHDLAFSPNLGRSYHVLAIATKDVRILNLTPVKYVYCLTNCQHILNENMFLVIIIAFKVE